MSTPRDSVWTEAVSKSAPPQETGVDYQMLFMVIPPEETETGRYDFTLEGIRDQDPDSYRLVVYGWA